MSDLIPHANLTQLRIHKSVPESVRKRFPGDAELGGAFLRFVTVCVGLGVASVVVGAGSLWLLSAIFGPNMRPILRLFG